MRVLWLGHFLPYPPRGGAPQRSFNLIRELSSRTELHFLGLSQVAHQPTDGDLREAVDALSSLCESVRVERIPFRSSRVGKAIQLSLALGTGRSYNEICLSSRRLRRLAAGRIAALAPDVVHVDSEMIAGWVPARADCAAVLNHHNVESHMLARRAAHARGPARFILALEARRLRAFERRHAPRFRRHVVVSPLDAERLRSIVGDVACDTVPNGVDVDYFAPAVARAPVPEEPPSLVFAGRMNWYPNEHAIEQFLCRLWPGIKSRIPGVRLIVAGMNPTQALLQHARSDPALTVTGFVADIRPTIARASVYVCPILDGGGTRVKLLDAMAMGKAIVATPLAVEGLRVDDGHHLLVREFGDSFVEGVCQVLVDPGLREALSRGAREQAVSLYSWCPIADGLIRAYRAASGER